MEALSAYEVGVLHTTLVWGGAEGIHLFDYLPAPTARAVRAYAQEIQLVPREERVRRIVGELERRRREESVAGMAEVETSWLVAALQEERPRIVAVILQALPPGVAEAVGARLPDQLRHHLPPREAVRTIAPEIRSVLRQRFAARFVPMAPPTDGPLDGIPDLPRLSASRLRRLVHVLGVEELATAFGAAGDRAVAELCQRLSPEIAEELLVTLRAGQGGEAPDRHSIHLLLDRAARGVAGEPEILEEAGLLRLARALVGEEERLVRRVAQRMPYRPGTVLIRRYRSLEERGAVGAEQVERLQRRILTALSVEEER